MKLFCGSSFHGRGRGPLWPPLDLPMKSVFLHMLKQQWLMVSYKAYRKV